MSISTIMSQIQSLSAADKLLLNQQLASCMVGQTTSVAAKSSRKGKPAAAGTLAWTAFVAHVVKSMPERFAPPALPKERLSIAGAIRLENPEAYKAFCEKFIADMPARDSDAESVTSPQESVASAPSADKPKRVISDEQKAKMKAGREATAAAKKNGTYVPKAKAAKAEKAEKPKPKPKAKGKKVAKAEPEPEPAAAVTVDSNLEKITVDGIAYWLNTANNNLYDLEGEGMGAFAGAYMPGNEEGEMVDFDAVEA